MNKSKSLKLRKFSKNPYTIIGTIILGIAVVHFAMQLSFIRHESLQSVETAAGDQIKIAPPEKPVIKIEPQEYVVRKVKVVTVPEIVKSAPRRSSEAAPVRKPEKKKEARETRAERLRRAERILTGV